MRWRKVDIEDTFFEAAIMGYADRLNFGGDEEEGI